MYFEIKTQKDNFPESSNRLSLTAFVMGIGGGLQVTLDKDYAILDGERAILLAYAILARYVGDITATGIEIIENPHNLIYQERQNEN
jgi:hypothetical protein